MAILNTNVGPERVQTLDQPLGVVQVPGAGTAVAGILISSSKAGAPLNAPTRVQSLTDFVDTFGDADEVSGDGYYAVKGFFDNAGTGSTAVIVHVGTTPTASDWIGDGMSTGLRALDSVDDLTLVMVPGLPLETAYLVHPQVIDYSETVRAEFGAALTTVFSLVSIPDAISSAQSDELVTSLPLNSVNPAGDNFDLAVGTTTLGSKAEATVEINSSGTVASVDMVTGGPTTTVSVNSGVSVSPSQLRDMLVAQINLSLGSLVTATPEATTKILIEVNTTGSAGNNFSVVALTNTNVIQPFSGGVDGSITPEDLSNVTPGMVVTNTADDFIAVVIAVDDILDTVTIAVDPTTSFDADSLVHISTPSAITYKETVVNNPSRFAAWYYNTLTVLDSSTGAADGATVTVDPVGHVAGVMSRMDSNLGIGGVSHAPAGIKYAGIAGIQGLRLQISERLDGGALRLNFINRITSFPGSGNVIFGGYTADSGTTPALTADEQLIQVMRTIQFIKASLDIGLRSFLWENFSPDTQAQVAASIQSFLRNNGHLFPAGLAEAQQFKVISVEATQDELDLGLLKVRIQLRPNKAVRFIEINLEYPIPVA